MARKRYGGEMRPGSRVRVESEDPEYHGREGMVSTTLPGFRVIVVFDGEREGTSLSAFDLVTVSSPDQTAESEAPIRVCVDCRAEVGQEDQFCWMCGRGEYDEGVEPRFDRPTDMIQCLECGEMVPDGPNCVKCRRRNPAVLEGGTGPLEIVEIEGSNQ